MIGRDMSIYPFIQPRSASRHPLYSDDIDAFHIPKTINEAGVEENAAAAAATVVVSGRVLFNCQRYARWKK